MTTDRWHADVIRRIKALATSTSASAVVGQATGHDMWGLRCGSQDAARRVLITGGVHGDEPAGVEAVLQFLEHSVADYVRHFHFVVIPCVNPSGYEANTRENGSGQDINRSMSNNGVIESMSLRQVIADQPFDLFFDLHEDYEATGFYMYEAERERRLLGEQIVDAVRQIGSIDSDDNTDPGLDMPVSEGLFEINPAWRTSGWSVYAYFESATHGVLTETPSTAWPLQTRVDAHLLALRLVLDHYTGTRTVPLT
ncbi:MAG: M14 family metallocarboxypeptidase [Gemmatimonadetes bacterium]|jgi:murein peptide amidase A|nr:M14 family metallocarboxypeptidase [Gemmatimonadota bacterium]MBT5591347.1 M14 family metallocarboxypeptidase [Gemmatimonadota bacterium]